LGRTPASFANAFCGRQHVFGCITDSTIRTVGAYLGSFFRSRDKDYLGVVL
jgi:hypothetical protein